MFTWMHVKRLLRVGICSKNDFMSTQLETSTMLLESQ